jgi:glycosyltransferase involved in cell wall biosynthesis
VNSTVSGYFLETLADQGFECVALVHELDGILERYELQGQARSISARAAKIVFAAEEVAASFRTFAPDFPFSKTVIRPQGLYKRRALPVDRSADREKLRRALGVPRDSQIVLAVGHADYRKGIDLFVDAGLKMAQQCPHAYWVWVGHLDAAEQLKLDAPLSAHPELRSRFIFPGRRTDTDMFYGGADIFALTSREDPFPSVVLEALDAELPVVAFEGAGGFTSLLRRGTGRLVPKEDTVAFARAIAELLNMPHERAALGQCGTRLIREHFSFQKYVFDLLSLADYNVPRVSVIVPNFNYARYLTERLSSVVNQAHPIYEILFLDDASSDESVSIARNLLEAQSIPYKIVLNDVNSGSVFSQWKKGVDLADGDYVWIAEADDSTDAGFLAEAMKGFHEPDVVLSYCESKQMDEDGRILADNYLEYVADIDADRWHRHFVNEGSAEISQALSIKNTIPNVSGVVFRKDRLQSVLNEHMPSIRTFRVAGDWLVYVLLLRNGKLAFSPRSLNKHRRHSRGVTIGSFDESQFNEIRRMQLLISEEFDIPPHAATTARRYLHQLTKQFGLVSDDDMPSHEELAPRKPTVPT